MRRRHRLDDREAESGSRIRGPVGRPGAADEPREHLGLHAGGDPGAVVGDLEHGVAVAALDRDPDLGACRRVAQAVVQQVDGQLVKLVRIALDRHRTMLGEGQAVPVRDRAHLG